MKRIEMEHIGYVPHVPQPGPHPGTLPVVQIDAERCVGCDTCQEYCPTGAIFGEVGREHAIPRLQSGTLDGDCAQPGQINIIGHLQAGAKGPGTGGNRVFHGQRADFDAGVNILHKPVPPS